MVCERTLTSPPLLRASRSWCGHRPLRTVESATIGKIKWRIGGAAARPPGRKETPMLGQRDRAIFPPSRSCRSPARLRAAYRRRPLLKKEAAVSAALPPAVASTPPRERQRFPAGQGRRAGIHRDGVNYPGVIARLPHRSPMCRRTRWHAYGLRERSAAARKE
jgi:hypothetical protein